MRRSLILLSLATTALVVISLVVPLGLLVQRQAADTAKVEAEQRAQSVAALVALALAVNNESSAVEEALGSLEPATIVALPGGSVIGEASDEQGSLVDVARSRGGIVTDDVAGGWEVALPVVGADGVAVVDVYVPDHRLTQGVLSAWLLLGALGVVLVGVAAALADRLGARLVTPIAALADSAHRLADGDLDARVVPSDPSEVREVAQAFNYLAGRLNQLLEEERESMADLSHRLRTPLTSLRLQAEALVADEERSALLAQVDRLEHAVNQVIHLARAPVAPGHDGAEINEVVSQRIEFWEVLADEQARLVETRLDLEAGTIQLDEGRLGAIVDVLIENVFLHTSPGTPVAVSTGRSMGRQWMEVADHGPGFDGVESLRRGFSGTGSTGLGLDIVRKTVEPLGGSIEMGDRPGGGAVVRVWLG